MRRGDTIDAFETNELKQLVLFVYKIEVAFDARED